MNKQILILVLILIIPAVLISTVANADDKKMAISLGLGLSIPIPGGDIGDSIDFAIPYLSSFQYAIISNISIEGALALPLHTSKNNDDYSIKQFCVGGRYWITDKFDFSNGKAYKDFYLGAGLAISKVEIEKPFSFTPWIRDIESDKKSTFILKGGYVLPAGPILLDLGGRYDLVDIFEFKLIDQSITLYGMACINF